jgi:subtilisin-like proprotein convertase family protein
MNSKQNRLALALVAAAGLASVASGQVYSNSSPLAIPDSPTVVSTIDVSGFVGTISDLNVVLNIDHTFDADVDVILIPPGQTGISYLQLFTDVGSTGDNFRWTRLDQAAAGVIGTTGFATAPFFGDYRPEGGTMTSTNWAAVAPWALASLGTGITNLDALNGIDPNGTWTLVIDDDLGGDTGTLQYWSLELNGATDSNVPAFAFNTATLSQSRFVSGTSDTSNATVTVISRTGGSVTSLQLSGAALSGGTPVSLVEGPAGTWTGSFSVDAAAPLGTNALSININGSPSGSVSVTVLPTAVPGCASGFATLSGSNLNSDGPVANVGNSIFTTDLTGTPGTANAVRISGRVRNLLTNSLITEARVRVVAPDGSAYLFQPVPTGTPTGGPFDVVSFQGTVTNELASGVWTVETYESSNQTGIDSNWETLCVALVSLPSGTGTGDTAFQGLGLPGFDNVLNYSVTASGGVPPYTVSVNASAFGGGTVTLTDPDNDNVFTGSYTLTGSELFGSFSTPATLTDSSGNSATAAITSGIRRGVTNIGEVSSANEGALITDAAHNAGEVRWFQFSVCSDVAAPSFFDLTATGTFGASADTEFGIYRTDGTLVSSDDDDGVLAGSAMSFGAGSGATQGGTGTTDTAPVIADGRDGATLPAGTYYLATGQFNVTFNTTNFSVVGAGVGAGTLSVVFDTDLTCGPVCNDIDINNDGSLFDPTDIDAFLSVFSEGPCVPAEATCDGIDFNNDTSLFDPCDIDAFLLVFSEGPCTLCGV